MGVGSGGSAAAGVVLPFGFNEASRLPMAWPGPLLRAEVNMIRHFRTLIAIYRKLSPQTEPTTHDTGGKRFTRPGG